MKYVNIYLIGFFLLQLLLLTSCSKEDSALLTVEQIRIELTEKHGTIISQAQITTLRSDQLSMPTGIDYIEHSKSNKGEFLAILIEEHLLDEPILDHFSLTHQLNEYDQQLDFVLVMTVDELQNTKKAKLNSPIIIRPLGGKCVGVAGGWNQCSFSQTHFQCNPFVLDGCGVGVPGDLPGGGNPPDTEPIGGN